MRAMVLTDVKKPLHLQNISKPICGPNDVLIKISCCAVCRTDLHIIDGELPKPKLPLVLGHQIVGKVEEIGKNVSSIKKGERVGVPWLHQTCGTCEFCQSEKENLCDFALFTGYDVNGGFAEYCLANPHFIFPIPSSYSDIQAAPLLCGGFIGYRAYRMIRDAKKIGFYGFGSSARILIQVARYKGVEVYAFTRPGNTEGQKFAKEMGAIWAGGSDEMPPERLDAAIIFAPAGDLIPTALKALKKGGVVVSAEIHMSDIPSFPYRLLWQERMIRSVANLTRKDGRELLDLASRFPIHTSVTTYSLEDTNRALEDLRHGKISGTAVIVI